MSPKLFNLLLIIGSFAMYYFLVGPLYSGKDTGIWTPEKNVVTLRQSISQYNTALSKVDSILKEADSLKKDFERLDDETKKNMEIMVPSKINDVRLLSEVSKIANESGLAVRDIAVKDKLGAFPKYTITITVKSTYQQFKDFIARYETSMRIFNVESVSFAQAEEDDGLIKFNILLSTHYLK